MNKIELTALAQMLQSRTSQIKTLNQLAPGIQGAPLNLTATQSPISSRNGCSWSMAMLQWNDQRGAGVTPAKVVGLQSDAVAKSDDQPSVTFSGFYG